MNILKEFANPRLAASGRGTVAHALAGGGTGVGDGARPAKNGRILGTTRDTCWHWPRSSACCSRAW